PAVAPPFPDATLFRARAEEVIEGLRRKTGQLERETAELRERLRGLEEGIGRRRAECAELERAHDGLKEALGRAEALRDERRARSDRKSTRLNSSHVKI